MTDREWLETVKVGDECLIGRPTGNRTDYTRSTVEKVSKLYVSARGGQKFHPSHITLALQPHPCAAIARCNRHPVQTPPIILRILPDRRNCARSFYSHQHRSPVRAFKTS